MSQDLINEVYRVLCEKAPAGADAHWFHEQICRARTLLARHTEEKDMNEENEAEVSPLLAGMHELKLSAEQGCAHKVYPESAKAIREKVLAQQEEIAKYKETIKEFNEECRKWNKDRGTV